MLRRHIASKGKHITNKGNVNPSDRAELGRHITSKSDVNSGDGSKIGSQTKFTRNGVRIRRHTPQATVQN